ncbi:MAG: hypothetical protein J2P28_08595 [Actinobacteria bacterium]|nr:hypothetical protein [Actinomycetota bacterium]
MQFAGRPSWRFGYGNGNCSHLLAALFARDSARLAIPPAPDVPPSLASEWLAGEPAAALSVLSEADLAAATDQWLAWWRALLVDTVAEAGSRPPADADAAAILAWVGSRHAAVFDPPDFDSLAAAPELRVVVRATQEAWPRGLPDRPGSFNYQLIRFIAEATAAYYGVSMEAIDATAHVLDVRGSWWHLAGPGCVLCSPGATADMAVAEQMLRAVFASRLGRT